MSGKTVTGEKKTTKGILGVYCMQGAGPSVRGPLPQHTAVCNPTQLQGGEKQVKR